MKAIKSRITFELADEYFSYDPDLGNLFWKKKPSTRDHIGNKAGCINAHGYQVVTLRGRRYTVSNIIWLLMTGEWPNGEVDHINRNRSDDRLINLRLATRSQNAGNSSLSANNTSGYRGVSWHEGHRKWHVHVTNRDFGYFDNKEEAARHYDKIATEMFGEFANLNFP